jgi:hypothetical protein
MKNLYCYSTLQSYVIGYVDATTTPSPDRAEESISIGQNTADEVSSTA